MSFFSQAFGGRYAPKASKDWIPAGLFSFSQKSKTGISVSEQTALFNSAVFACRRAISESVAIIPREIFRELDDDRREKVRKHPSLNLIKRETNRILTPYNFFRLTQDRAIGSGNGYAELQFSTKDGSVIAAWPIPPYAVEPFLFDNKGTLDVAYEITLPEGDKTYLSRDRMLHVAGLGFDGVRGYPLVEYMLHAVGLSEALEEYSSLFFKQGAQVPGYVTVPDSFSESQIRNMREHVTINNEGLDNAHRWKFLYESAKFHEAGFSPTDAQMTESKIFQIQEIARFHRIPLHKIQETSRGTGYASLEQFNIEFVNDTLAPWITNWEEELNRKLFSANGDFDGHYVKFDLNVLLKGDAKARATFLRTMVFSGIMTRNEARALEDLPPVAGGDEMLIPLNMTQDAETNDTGKADDGRERIQD